MDPRCLDAVEDLHAEVDAAAGGLAAGLGELLVCGRGCAGCCLDDLTVFPVEAAVIARHHATLLATGEAHPPGACAFLDTAGACRIYPQRPYVCRTQGLPLRWLVDGGERRDICPLNSAVPLADLTADRCWTLGPWEGRLASLQAEASGRFELERVSLRSLFGAPANPGRGG